MEFWEWARDKENAAAFCDMHERLYREAIDGTPISYYIIFNGEYVREFEEWGNFLPEDVWRGESEIVAKFGDTWARGLVREWMESDGSTVEEDEHCVLHVGDYTEYDAVEDIVREAKEAGIVPTPDTLDEWIDQNILALSW